ncbi:MAG: chorismate synthase, partial [Candidatus Delongbacteria bacterium]|nr:chorismate synthase [Candidatus Delongbacteria bacterium]
GKKGTTSRIETDDPEIISGVFEGKTTGAPITILFQNENSRSQDYSSLKNTPRPGHADFVAGVKFKGYNDHRGGGHFSGRITLGLVSAGVIAKKILTLKGIKISSKIIEVGGMKDKKDIDALIDKTTKDGDSLGAVIECKIKNVNIGLGEPFFDSVESMISHAVFSVPGIKGIEFGSGFSSAAMKGSELNDTIISRKGKTLSNNSGGINGGISNGNEIIFRIAIRPTPSISIPQNTINLATGKREELIIHGRHDVCFALRVPPIIEAVGAMVIVDLMLRNKSLQMNNNRRS